ncbi:MAG: hypothetical protein M1827_006613 [Pycnora praestabilis]|nr:MAG: hypothetical protein M1827_006613 [Pycnora praestabilis]
MSTSDNTRLSSTLMVINNSAIWRHAVVITGVLTLTYMLLRSISKLRSRRQRLQSLGSFAPVVPSSAPLGTPLSRTIFKSKYLVKAPNVHVLGLDLIIKALRLMHSHQFFEWSRNLLNVPGRTTELHMLSVRLIMTDDVENIKAIMSTQFSDFGKGELVHKVYDNVLGDSIFASEVPPNLEIRSMYADQASHIADGDEWLANKNQLRPHVAKIRPTDCNLIEKHFVQFLKNVPNDDSPVEVYDLIDRYQLDVVTDVFLGESAESLSRNRQPFRDAMDDLLKYNTTRLLFGPVGLLAPDTLVARGSVNELNNYLDTHVQRAAALSKTDLEGKPEKDITLMDSMALERMNAKDPVAILLTWAIYELSRNPGMVVKLRSEIASNVGYTAQPTVADVKVMPYLKNIVRETMRLYHPVGFNIRSAKVDTTLPRGGGTSGNEPVGVLAGTQIGLQRRHDLVGPDADLFKPERWETWTPDLWEFIPFNHGPRICLGRVFGQFQMSYTLIRIFQEFKGVELVDSGEQRIKMELNTKMAYPSVQKAV